MGRQIQFFMNERDEKEFVDFIYSNNDILIMNKVDKDGNVQIVKKLEDLEFNQYFIYSPSMKLVIKENGFIDDTISEVIEFSTPRKKNNIMELHGRLYVILKDWDKRGNLVTKSPQLEKKYNLYKKYITKNFRISQDKYFYIGPGAYEWYKRGGKIMAGPIVEVKF